MKQIKNFTLKFVGVMIAIMAFVLGFTSCNDDTTTDSTSFALYYTSMTDISPTMTGTIASPTYKGASPSGFSIIGVTFGDDNQSYTGDSFIIDETTGVITISNTSELQVGKYKISVSCIAGGKSYHFQDAIIVNFMKAVPDGITVEPAELQVEYADILNTEDQTITLPTAQVKTDGEHISITGYEISSIRKGEQIIENFPNPLFTISSTGEISVVKGNQSIEIGTYVLNLKLNTAVAGSDSELGLYADAVKINVISKPLSLTYEPNESLLEESPTNETEYISNEPILEGSLEGIDYSIASISPATDKITIEPTTGKIVVEKGHGFSKGESYTVSVLVKNQFCEEGVLFEDVFKLNIVEFIEPIANFSYPEITVKQALKIDVQKNAGFQGGGNLIFAFSEEDKAKYDGILTLEAETGRITAPKYNTLEIGEYDVHVIATNNKGSQEAILRLNVEENEYYFSYISYGNNLVTDQTPNTIYDNQFRFRTLEEVQGTSLVPKIDIKEGVDVKWTYSIKHQGSGITMDDSGIISLAGVNNSNFTGKVFPIIFVTATAGEGEYEISRTFPVFINYSLPLNGVTIEYTPFVFRVNPKTGGTSQVPDIIGSSLDMSKVYIDFYNTNSYFNLNGIRTDGDGTSLEDGRVDKADGSIFLRNLWDKYGNSNYSANYPISYYDGDVPKTNLQDNLLYINNAESNKKYSLVVNSNKWYDNGWADGVYIGKLKFTTNGTLPIPTTNSNFYIAIWFDKDYTQK